MRLTTLRSLYLSRWGLAPSLAVALGAALSGCSPAQGLDVVNGCAGPITVFSGADDVRGGTDVRVDTLAPGEVAVTYLPAGPASAVYVRPDAAAGWVGPLDMASATPVPDGALVYVIEGEWCSPAGVTA